MPARRRLDAELVRRGLASGRTEASELVAAGRVLVGGALAEKAARQVAPDEPLVVCGPPARFASRGGEKLDAALDRFRIDVVGCEVLDAGASTGGFTDCLLQRGAAKVVAVDVGHGQMLERLRREPRVELIERCNIRSLTPSAIGGRRFPVVAADLSFISLRTVAPALVGLCVPGGDLVVLVKPQFEAGRQEVSRGHGVVRGRDVWRRTLEGVTGAFLREGTHLRGAMVSPIAGSSGNVEFLLHLVLGGVASRDIGPCLGGGVEERSRLEPEEVGMVLGDAVRDACASYGAWRGR